MTIKAQTGPGAELPIEGAGAGGVGQSGGSSMESRVGARGEQKRRWDRENYLTCTCGRRMSRKAEMCITCRRAAMAAPRNERARRIEAWWAQGLSMKAIGERLGWSVYTVGFELNWMRRQGYDLPRRNRGYGVRRESTEERPPRPSAAPPQSLDGQFEVKPR